MSAVLPIAVCQFAVEADIAHNLREILRQIDEASQRGARVVHFSETALSGYAGCDWTDLSALDWNALREATEEVCRAAARHGVWVLLGSTHPLSAGHKPHNSIYVISDEGRIVERYDKRFCTGVAEPQPALDHQHYTPGNHTTVFELDGWRCGVLICYDYRFPELYRDLKRRGVEVVFHSFHNARRDERSFREGNIWREIVPATIMCHAATNHVWISANNSTTQYSYWPSFFVRPDGTVVDRLELGVPGVMLVRAERNIDLWDAAAPWRQRAMDGILHSGQPVDDPRSTDRTCL